MYLTAFAAASGCGLLGFGADPMDDVELLSDVTLAPDVEEAALVAPTADPSILSDLISVFRRDRADDAEPAALVTTDEAPIADTPVEDEAEEGAESLAMVVGNVAEVGAPEVVEGPEAEPQVGVLGFLTGLLPDLDVAAAQDTDQVVAETPLAPPAFGEIVSVCGMATADLGTKIADVSGYKVYDSAPGSVQLRAHYVTGFNDRCVRRFDAALVLMGDIGTHEVVRYSKTRVDLDYSETDEAYETIKARFCGVARGAPCGGKLDRLARNTTFITAYESFGAAPQWAEFLLHNGDVAGADIEG